MQTPYAQRHDRKGHRPASHASHNDCRKEAYKELRYLAEIERAPRDQVHVEAVILHPGASSSVQRLAPVAARFSLEFDFVASAPCTFHVTATLAQGQRSIANVAIRCTVGQPTGRCDGIATVPDVSAREGIVDGRVIGGRQAVWDRVPLPNGRIFSGGTAEFIFSSEFDGLSGHVVLPGNESAPSLVFGRYFSFPAGRNTIDATVGIAGATVVSSRQSFIAD